METLYRLSYRGQPTRNTTGFARRFSNQRAIAACGSPFRASCESVVDAASEPFGAAVDCSRIKDSQADSPAIAPAPSATMICLKGTSVQSPAAKTRGTLVAP